MRTALLYVVAPALDLILLTLPFFLATSKTSLICFENSRKAFQSSSPRSLALFLPPILQLLVSRANLGRQLLNTHGLSGNGLLV